MFKAIISKLRQITRFDRIVNSAALTVGEVEGQNGKSALALQLPTSEVVVLNDHAKGQLAAQWGVPSAHLDRLPNELAAEEIHHFARSAPRDITIRAIQEPGEMYPAARAVLSGKYQPFDTHEVLEAIEPHVQGFDVSSSSMGRDEARMLLTLPGHAYDVSSRKAGDICRAGIMISNSEVGTMALRVEFSLLRLVCTNGMTSSEFEATRIRHIHIDREGFIQKLRECVARAGEVGAQIARRVAATHSLMLRDLNPDNGKLQREVVSILRRENVWTQTLQREAEQALIDSGELSLFSLIQHLTDNVRLSAAPLSERVRMERIAGRLAALA